VDEVGGARGNSTGRWETFYNKNKETDRGGVEKIQGKRVHFSNAKKLLRDTKTIGEGKRHSLTGDQKTKDREGEYE